MLQATVANLRPVKGKGSRISGLERLREYLAASLQIPMEAPGIFIFNHCMEWLRTVPSLDRDPRNLEDANSEGEDHAYDATRYRLSQPHYETTVQEI